jgi:hypothetical protein
MTMSPSRPVLLVFLVAAVVLAPASQTVAAASAAGPPAPSERPDDPDVRPVLEPADPASLTADRSFATISAQPNTSNYLGIRDRAVERSDQSRAGLNVGSAVQQDVTELQSEYASLTFEQRYENTTGQQARLDVLHDEVGRLERRVQDLELRRNRAIDAYNSGDLGTESFLRELAAIDAAARGIESQFNRIRQAAGLELPSDLTTKTTNLEADLLSLRGPVRQQVAQGMAGSRDSIPVYTVTSQTGVVLTSVQGSLYYREAYLGQNRDQVGTDRFVTDSDPSGVSTANNRATQLYPWVYDNIRSGPDVETIGNTSIYYVRLGHPHGSLDTYLDGRTESVFREFQGKSLDALPVTTSSNVSDGLSLRVNRTHSTGPMELVVTDNATGDPVDATVVVNGDEVGSTGSDGRLWTLTPQRAVRVSVTTDTGRSVTERFFAD